jgi:hypothetical protein
MVPRWREYPKGGPEITPEITGYGYLPILAISAIFR